MTADSTTGVTTRTRGGAAPPEGGVETIARNWRAVVARYQHADTRRALTQIATTLLPLTGSLYLMYRSLEWSYWIR